MKKFLAMLLALVMVFACAVAFADAVDPETIADEFESADGKFELAFVTDVGQLKDKSFNQGTWNGVKLYAAANGLGYKYYQPANGDQATDDDRYEAMKAACEGGAKVVVCAGFMQAAALERLPRNIRTSSSSSSTAGSWALPTLRRSPSWKSRAAISPAMLT